MRFRLLVSGLILTAFALGGMVLLGVGLGLHAAIIGHPFEVELYLRSLWLLFTTGTLLIAFSSPYGARLAAALLCGLSLFSSFLILQGNNSALVGSIFCVFALLLHCGYQNQLARMLDDQKLTKLIQRAYDRPLKLFLLGTLILIVSRLVQVGDVLVMPLCLLTFVACPIWGFAYLGVVTMHLVKVLKGLGKEIEPVRAHAEF